MPFNPSATELTTAATDAALGAVCCVLALWLHRVPINTTLKRSVWVWLFALLAFASALGAVVHGLALPAGIRTILWQPLYLSLGFGVSLFLVGAVADWRGDAAARMLLPWGIGLGGAFFVLSRLLGGSFVVFVAYEGLAVLAALSLYVILAFSRRAPGAATLAAGIALSMAAAAIQQTRLSVTLFVPFDHNGIFHIVQMVAMVVMASGIRRGLEATGPQMKADLRVRLSGAT